MVQRSVANMSLLVGQAVKGGTAAARVAEVRLYIMTIQPLLGSW